MTEQQPKPMHVWRFYQENAWVAYVICTPVADGRSWWREVSHHICDIPNLHRFDANEVAAALEWLFMDLRKLLVDNPDNRQ